MKPQPNFYVDEIIRTIEDISEGEAENEGFVTVKEMHRAIGWPLEKIREYLYVLKKEGRLEVGRKRVEFLDGRVIGKPAYKLKSKEEEKE